MWLARLPSGLRQVRIPAILAARDIDDLDMEHMYLDALALVELAPGGTGPVLARALEARQERATRMQTGKWGTHGRGRGRAVRGVGLWPVGSARAHALPWLQAAPR